MFVEIWAVPMRSLHKNEKTENTRYLELWRNKWTVIYRRYWNKNVSQPSVRSHNRQLVRIQCPSLVDESSVPGYTVPGTRQCRVLSQVHCHRYHTMSTAIFHDSETPDGSGIHRSEKLPSFTMRYLFSRDCAFHSPPSFHSPPFADQLI